MDETYTIGGYGPQKDCHEDWRYIKLNFDNANGWEVMLETISIPNSICTLFD
jgi:hypothetical protein